MEYTNFEVKCRSLQDDVVGAWSSSHAHEDVELSKDNLLKMQLPVTGFRSYSLYITSSILFRDLMLTVRPCASWALSMRNYSYTKDTIKLSNECEMYEGSENLQSRIDEVIRQVSIGVPKDQAKQKLPMLTSVSFNIMISHRTLVNWLYSIKLHIPRYFEFIKRHFFAACQFSEELFNESKKIDLWNYLAITPKEYSEFSSSSQMMDMHAVFAEVQCNLMAQFIRQNQSTVKNGLYNICNEDLNKALSMYCNDLVHCGAYITSDSLRYLISKRTCWFAQFDADDRSSWAYLLGDTISKMSVEEFMENLPCGGLGCNCDIKQDMINKAARKDASPPCPLFIENSDMMKIRHEFYGKSSKVTEKWKEVCDEIYTNPDNEYSKLYFGR